MRIIFFGTPDYVLPILNSVHKKFSHRGVSPIAAVVTQPPRPSGREQVLQYSTVDTWAFKRKIPVFHGCQEFLKAGLTADVGILAAYGEIIPQSAIDYFPFGILNIHPSILPKWRGASPVQAPIIAGEKETGVSIIKLDEKLDHGPSVSQFKEEILDNDTTESLRARLFERSAEVLVELLEAYLKKKITPRPQNHKEATFTTQIKKQDAFIPPEYLNAALQGQTFSSFAKGYGGSAETLREGGKGEWEISFMKDYSLVPSAYCLECFIRAMYPWPMSWTLLHQGFGGQARRLKILKAHLQKLVPSAYCLVPDLVQLEGKSPVSWKQFKEAYPNALFAEE